MTRRDLKALGGALFPITLIALVIFILFQLWPSGGFIEAAINNTVSTCTSSGGVDTCVHRIEPASGGE